MKTLNATKLETKRCWNDRYRQGGAIYGTEPSPAAKLAVFKDFFNRFKPGQKLLEIGGGYGRNAFFFASRGMSVVSLDISDEAIKLGTSLRETTPPMDADSYPTKDDYAKLGLFDHINKDSPGPAVGAANHELKKWRNENPGKTSADVTFVEGDAAKLGNLFEKHAFDGIFSNFCLHLLSEEERHAIVTQLPFFMKPFGRTVFSLLSSKDADYGKGTEVALNTFQMPDGRLQHFFTEAEIYAMFATQTYASFTVHRARFEDLNRSAVGLAIQPREVEPRQEEESVLGTARKTSYWLVRLVNQPVYEHDYYGNYDP